RFVEDEPLADVGDVALGYVGRDAELDLGLEVRLRVLAAQLAYRLLEQVGVELEADGRDVSRLLLPEEIPRAANLEVVGREPEAAAEVIQLLEHPEPFLRIGGDAMLAPDHHIRVSAVVGAAHPPAELV